MSSKINNSVVNPREQTVHNLSLIISTFTPNIAAKIYQFKTISLMFTDNRC